MARDFYVPVMSNCCRFDRISCYFTPDALAHYCEGIYYLGLNGGKYRLLISENVSEQTFNIIREGYQASLLIDDIVKERMKDQLSLENHVLLSNLAYLLKCGLVEIRFALCFRGLFHEKAGYAEDDCGNQLSFVGSNNETSESMEINYEKFEITTSWLSSDFDRTKIIDAKNEFDSMWSGNNKYVKVIDPPESFEKYMDSFNRGRLFQDVSDYSENDFVFDFNDGQVVMQVPVDVDPISFRFIVAIQSSVDKIVDRLVSIKRTISRKGIDAIVSKVERYAVKNGKGLLLTESFKLFLNTSSGLDKMSKIGRMVKARDSSLLDSFRVFKADVSSLTVNILRDEQLWDSFFAFMLKKSANFSVPGSGKTATALGMFAYLYKNYGVKRLIVLGPLNSFDSWINEFSRIFGDKIPLRSITSTQLRDMGGSMKQHIMFDLGGYNLILLNYESFNPSAGLMDSVRNRIDDSTMLVMDEVHRIKAIDGKRATQIIPISENSKYTIVMTGTPIPNDYSDVYNFLHILYGRDYDDYFSLTPKELSLLHGKSIDDFNMKLSPFFCRTTKNDLHVTPAEQDIIVAVKATSEEEALFRELQKMSMNPLALIIRILQLESNPSMLSHCSLTKEECDAFFGDSVEESAINMESLSVGNDFITSKVARCIDLVDDLVSSGKTVIIWSIFIKTIETLSTLLSGRGIECKSIHGGTENRSEIIDGFKKRSFPVLITNPQTLAESVSLHMSCHDAIYFEYSYNLIHMLQSKDRIHRLGLPPGQYTQYYFLETMFDREGNLVSLDQQIHDRLNQKEKIMLNAIENDSLECFESTDTEIEDLLNSIGFNSFNYD